MEIQGTQQLALNLSDMLEYYTECYNLSEEGTVVACVYNVPNELIEDIENKIFEYSYANYDKFGFSIIAQVKSEEITKDFYSDKLQMVEEFKASHLTT
ncbi:MAG: hypothetical protein GY749_23125 [Desulfobacteraceae bacterium]|nr:hypothetical protein [Desulfobacteraceae bacterium]